MTAGRVIACPALLLALLLALVSARPAWAVQPPQGLQVAPPPYDGGLNLRLAWTNPPDPERAGLAILRAAGPEGPWEVVADLLPPDTDRFTVRLTTNPRAEPPPERVAFRVVALAAEQADPTWPGEGADRAAALAASPGAGPPVVGSPRAAWLDTSPGRVMLGLLILAVGGLMLTFTRRAQRGEDIYIRRMPGIDAIEEGIGRATEMGRPVLYVPGIDELQDIQTIASMLILGQVARTVAEYQSDIIVACCIPIVREVADEVVRAGYYQAGHPDAYRPTDVRFISSEQFAFCAGTNGIILREKPATNIYLGRFFAESLILAETGYINRSIQIAGTAEATQLPFFVAACDYTLIGEELFAVSAYLSRDPRLVSSLKASDYVKLVCVAAILLGTLEATLLGSGWIQLLFTIAEGG